MKNILLLNAGTRNTLVQNFKNTVGNTCKIIVTDNYFLAPALYDADKYYTTKFWFEDGYWDEIEEICKEENIGLIMSLIDPELELLAAQRTRFEKLGILVNVGDENTIKTTFDKYATLQFIKELGFPFIQTYASFTDAKHAMDARELNLPVFVKPRKGSGSCRIEKVDTIERLEEICFAHNDLIIQEYMNGREIGCDIYVDLISGEVVSIFTKQKLKMRAGETDKSVSFKDDKLFQLISDFAKAFGLSGSNDIDVFEKDGEYYISEVNPRFGGGYLHAYAVGVDFPQFLLNNMNGIANDAAIGDYPENTYMMKYFSIKILNGENLV